MVLVLVMVEVEVMVVVAMATLPSDLGHQPRFRTADPRNTHISRQSLLTSAFFQKSERRQRFHSDANEEIVALYLDPEVSLFGRALHQGNDQGFELTFWTFHTLSVQDGSVVVTIDFQ